MFFIFTIFLTTLTSVLAYVATKGTRPVKADSVRQAIRALFEWIGAFALFLAVNVILGAIVIVIIRGITEHFIGVYDLENPLLMIFSAAQGFVFRLAWNRD